MGWGSGSSLAETIIQTVKLNVADEKCRIAIYVPIIEALRDADWDTEDEVMGIDTAFDKALT